MSCRTIVLVFVILTDVLFGQELVLQPVGDRISQSLKGSTVITCSVSLQDEGANNNFTLHWIDNNNLEVMAKIGRVYVEEEGPNLKKLYVTAITESDAGLYTCRSKISGTWQQKQILLRVFKDITFDNAPEVQNPGINTDALILCEVSAIPKPQVSWRYEGNRIHYGERFVKEPNGLRIYGITESDNGNYTCRAEVEMDGRYEERKIKVVVHIPPKITKNLTVLVGVQGTDLAMSCQANGLPSPLYEFLKDNKTEPLVSTSRILIENSTGHIYFNPLDKEDEGKYTCRVSNDAGNDTSTGELRVNVPPFIDPLSEVVVSEGDTAIIECRSNGDPSPELNFQWTESQSRKNDNGRIIVTNPSEGYLVVSISNVVPSDSGTYICQARSSVGSHERTGNLKVLFRPRFYENQSNAEYIWAGKTRNITCSASSMPKPTFEWLRSGSLIRNNDTYQVFSLGWSSYLQILVKETDQGWIYGPYICRVRNNLGEDETTINLYRASVPDAPKLVDLVIAYPTSVVLRAIPPEEDGGMPVFGYRIEYEDKVQDFSLSDDIRIDGLKPSTTYIFKVRAKNEVGIGNGLEQTVITAAIREPYPVEITSEQEGKDAYEYVVTWKPPINGGLVIMNFKFSYRKVSVEKGTFNISQPLEDWTVYSTDDLPLNYYQLRDVQPSSYYELEIRTYNSMGWSEPNKQFVFLTAEDLYATTSASTFPSTTLALSSSSQNSSLPSSDTPPPFAVVSAASADDHLPNMAVTTAEPAGTDLGPQSGSSEVAHIAVPIIVVVVVIFLLFLAIVDISCYFMNACGLTMFICVHMCGREPRKYKDKGLEEGESDKKPLSDDVVQEMEPLATCHSGAELSSSHHQDDYANGAPDARVRLKNVTEADETEC